MNTCHMCNRRIGECHSATSCINYRAEVASIFVATATNIPADGTVNRGVNHGRASLPDARAYAQRLAARGERDES
jgi:hypothetical protein